MRSGIFSLLVICSIPYFPYVLIVYSCLTDNISILNGLVEIRKGLSKHTSLSHLPFPPGQLEGEVVLIQKDVEQKGSQGMQTQGPPTSEV